MKFVVAIFDVVALQIFLKIKLMPRRPFVNILSDLVVCVS